MLMVFIVGRRVRRAARPRAQSATRWTIGALTVWIVVEFAAFFLILTIITVANFFTGVPSDELAPTLVLIGYLPALALGAYAGDRVVVRLERRPELVDAPTRS